MSVAFCSHLTTRYSTAIKRKQLKYFASLICGEIQRKDPINFRTLCVDVSRKTEMLNYPEGIPLGQKRYSIQLHNQPQFEDNPN